MDNEYKDEIVDELAEDTTDDMEDAVEDTDADTRDIIEDTDADTRDIAKMIDGLYDKIDNMFEQLSSVIISSGAVVNDAEPSVVESAVEAWEELDELDYL